MDLKRFSSTTLQQNSETENIIQTMIKTIDTNKKFNRLIIYALNNLKAYLIIPIESQALEYSSLILKSNFKDPNSLDNFIELIEAVIIKHIANEELLLKIGDVFVTLLTQNSKHRETIKLFNNNKGFVLLTYIFENVDPKMTEVYKIFIKVLKILLDDKSIKFDTELETTINALLNKFEKENDIIIYILELITALLGNQNNIELFSTNLLKKIIELIAQTESEKIGSLCVNILDRLSGEIDLKEKIRNYKSISFIIKLLTKFKNSNALTFVSNLLDITLLIIIL